MKNCPNCNAQMDDNAVFCASCGAQLGTVPPGQGYAPQQPVYAPPYDQFDHTAEYDPKDISENKIYAMLAYLLGAIGIIVALLGAAQSPYAKFHIRQALKFTVIETLTILCMSLFFWVIFIPLIAGGIFITVLFVIKIICFFQICAGKAKEPAIIRSFGFLK